MVEETREILQHLETAANVAKVADRVGLFKKLGDVFRPNITVALELRASERVSCKGFQGSGLVPPAPPRLPYRQVSALIK